MTKLLLFALASMYLYSMPVFAANWSKTQLHLNYGEFTNPFTRSEAKTSVFSLQHASAYDYGENFFFVDYLDDDIQDNYQDRDFYMEWYSTVSLSAVSGYSFQKGILKDIGLVMGVNIAGDPKVVKYLPGIKLSWDIPGFTYLSTTITGYFDDSAGVAKQGAPSQSNAWMFDLAWGYPFTLGDHKFLFTGHAEYIGSRQNEFGIYVNDWLLAQPILQWDLGHALGNKSDTLMLGIEWQIWRNKLGGTVNESVPQIHLAWTF
ncbi:nucleoside-binding protein [Pseudoalteromonas sp. MMG013]|uniref:nucleoside-binding protein n=1 Tax=unclassified Pseudoalteromonas TaxID=194690 RepID=UPI001B35FC73|nr:MULTISPECIES: nucleoside-binding protein [unclassified Pseudoalteromonas]MBQ4852683.1 nucleoside-binding protein [Pseudoalteromonas sp. MMG012]MBQ4863798.1 nucleoside-binding protein [Pseudoalteromonas sp. MMG013]